MVNLVDFAFEKEGYWYIIRPVDNHYVAYAKKERFIHAGPDLFIKEPGDLWFVFAETWKEAFESIEKEVSQND